MQMLYFQVPIHPNNSEIESIIVILGAEQATDEIIVFKRRFCVFLPLVDVSNLQNAQWKA